MSFYPCVTNKAPFVKCVIKGTLYGGALASWTNAESGQSQSFPETSSTYNWTITLNLEAGTYTSSGFNSKKTASGGGFSLSSAYGGTFVVNYKSTVNVTITSVTFS